eukprot:SAG11_NODE_3463_length_2432_cov_39.107158_1_plen_388_part_00
MLASLPGAAPRFGKAVVGVSDGGGDRNRRVRVRFDDGALSDERFDVVVGCDGIHSRLRGCVDGSAVACNASNDSIKASNASAVVNLIGVAGPRVQLASACPELAAALRQRPAFTVYLDPAVTLLVAPVASDSVMFCVVASAQHFPEDSSSGSGGGGGSSSDYDLRGALEKFMRACSPPPSAFVMAVVETCLAHTPVDPDNSDALRLWRCRDIEPQRSFVHKSGGGGGSVALVGDAAHAALPWTGLGISAAALDAQRLAVALAEANDGAAADGAAAADAPRRPPSPGAVAAALERYDADRRPRGHIVQKAARASDAGQGPSAYNVGRRVLRVLPLKLLYGVQDALVRDAGGAVLDAGECRTAESELCVKAAVAVVAAAAFVFVARLVF